ncbi:ABC transporter permease [Bifidobacterium simiiventris]|uniref:ABC transporter permease n=1 Tax=Bifidobacterium simiiventris TaxID=2834434 RepID=UPI001C579498|nr:ABC transporter permease [Bifidobacterium simiiventris]MBW3079661.1 ABC transporter permease [Bifidobacterium simiiventris]
MFVLKNAWAELMRHKLRTLLTLLVALLAAFGTLFGWSVQQANTTATTTDREALAPGAIVRLTDAQQAKYNGADKTWVKNYLSTEDYNNYYAVVTANSITLSNINASSSFPVRQTKNSVQAIAGTDDQDASKTGGELTLKSFTSVDTARNNDLGAYTVIQGKHLSYSGKAPKGALISKALADKNNLKVGDEITVASPADASKTTTFTVRGIYEYNDSTAPAGHGSDAKLSKDNRDNAIYVSYSTMYNLNWGNESATDWSKPNLSYVFEFSSLSDYNKYAKKIASKIDKKHELASPTIEAYEKKTEPLTALASRMGVANVAVPVVGGVLLLALVLLGVVRRSAELGTALASGVTRGRMAWQFMLEAFFPVFLGLFVGLLAAGFGSKALGAALAGGYATPVTSAIVWRAVWTALGVLVVLMIVAGLRAAFFKTSTLFAARDGWGVTDAAAADGSDGAVESGSAEGEPESADSESSESGSAESGSAESAEATA